MRIPSNEELKAVAEVLVTWGFQIIVCGAITMLIGFIIIALCNKEIIKNLR